MLQDISFTVKNATTRLWYFSVDGIYLKRENFIDTISMAVKKKDKHFWAAQKGLRMDVECAFGVFMSRLLIIESLWMFWHRTVMKWTFIAAVILNNKAVEAWRDGYER